MPESFPRLENPENNLDKEALKQKIAANFDDIKKTVYDMDQEKKNAGVHSMANKQLSTESMEYVMDPMQLKKERGKRSTKKKKHQFALEETPEQAIQKAFDQQQQKELAVFSSYEGDSKQTTKTNKQVEQIEQKYEQKITQEQTTLEQQVTKCAEIKETNPSDYQEVKGWFLLHAEMTTDALLGTQVMGKRCKQLTTTLLASQIAVIEEKEVTQEKLTADQIVEKFIAAKKSYELKKDKESEQNLLDERLEQNSPFEKEFTKKQKKELFDINISSDFADIASPATPRQIVDRKEIFGKSDDSIDKIVNSTDAGRLYQRVAKNNPAAITRITAAHRYVKPNAVYEEVVRHDVITYAMTMYKYFLQEIYLQIWKETGYEETPSQPTDRSNPYVLIQETQTNLEKDANLYTNYITDLQDYCKKENITQPQINEANAGIQSFINVLNKTFKGKQLPKEYMDKKYGIYLDTTKLFEHLRLYQAYQEQLGKYIEKHTEEIKKANDTIDEFTTRIQTEKSATPTPEEVTDKQCYVDEYLKAVGTRDAFWKEENKIRNDNGSVVIDDMEKYAVAEKVQEVTQQIGSENLKKRSRITGKLTKQRTDWLKENQFTRNGRSAETALTSYARYITRLSNHPDFTRASKNYEALTKVFDAQTKDLSSSSQILFPATRQDMQNQKLKQAEVDQFYASLKNHTPALYGIINLGSQFISGFGNAIRGVGPEIGSFLSSPFMSDANLASHQDLINRFKSWVTIPSSSAMKTPLVNESGKTNFTVDNILSQTGSAAGYTTALLAMAGTKGSRLKNVRVSGARLQPWLYTSAPLVETGMELTIGGYFTQARQQGLSKADAYRYSLIQSGTNSLLELISPNRLANIGPMKFNTQLLQGKSRNVLIRYFLEEIVEENAQEVTQQITEDQFNTYFNAYKQTSFQDSMTRGDVQSLVLITSLSTGLVQTHGALQIYETLTATQALYQKHLQMLDDLMKKGSLPQGVKIENIEKVQKMLENTRAKKLSALSAEELKTLLAGTNDKFHDYGRAREVLLPDDPKLSLQTLLQGHPKIRKLLSEITNDFSPDACKKIRTDVEQSISSLFDHPIYGPLVNLMLYLDETLAKDESIDDDSGTITVSQTSIHVRTLLAELLLPELKNHTFPGYATLQELIADAHDEPTNAQTARILFGAGLINSQVTTLMRLGICGKVRADDISGKLSTQPLLINGVEGIVEVGASSLVVTIEGKPIPAFPSSQGRIDCAKAIRKGDTIGFSLKDKKGNPIEIAPSIQELLLTYISNQNEFSESRNDDCYAFLAKATEGDQPGGWYDLMQRNAEGALNTDEIETFKEMVIPVDEREINEIPIGSILLFQTTINGQLGYSHSAVCLGQGKYLSKLGENNSNLVVTNLQDLKKLYRSTTSYSNISYILPGNIPTTTLELPKRAEEFKAEPDIATILDQSPPPDHRFQKRSPDATLGGSGFIIKSLNKEINYEQWKEPKIYHIENTDVTSYNYYAYNTSSNAKTLIDRWSDAFNNALTGVLPGMKEGKAYERIRDNIHDKRVATQDPDYMYFATYNKYKDIQELFAKRAKQQPSLGQEAIEQIQTAMTAFIKEFGYLRGYKSSDIYGGSAIENFIYKKSAQAELFDKLYTVFTQIDATVNKDMSKPIEKKYGGDVSIFKLFKAARTRAEENMEKQIGDVMYTFTFTTGEKLSEKLLERFFFFGDAFTNLAAAEYPAYADEKLLPKDTPETIRQQIVQLVELHLAITQKLGQIEVGEKGGSELVTLLSDLNDWVYSPQSIALKNNARTPTGEEARNRAIINRLKIFFSDLSALHAQSLVRSLETVGVQKIKEMIAQKGNILDVSTTPEELKNIIISLLSIDDKPTTQALVFALAKTEFFPGGLTAIQKKQIAELAWEIHTMKVQGDESLEQLNTRKSKALYTGLQAIGIVDISAQTIVRTLLKLGICGTTETLEHLSQEKREGLLMHYINNYGPGLILYAEGIKSTYRSLSTYLQECTNKNAPAFLQLNRNRIKQFEKEVTDMMKTIHSGEGREKFDPGFKKIQDKRLSPEQRRWSPNDPEIQKDVLFQSVIPPHLKDFLIPSSEKQNTYTFSPRGVGDVINLHNKLTQAKEASFIDNLTSTDTSITFTLEGETYTVSRNNRASSYDLERMATYFAVKTEIFDWMNELLTQGISRDDYNALKILFFTLVDGYRAQGKNITNVLVKLHSKILETQNKIGKQDTDALIAAYKVLLSDASLLENGLEENIQDRIEKLNNFCNGTLLSSVRFKKLYGAIEQTTPKIAKQINSQFRQFLSILQRQCIVYTTYDDREDFLTSIDPLFSEVTQGHDLSELKVLQSLTQGVAELPGPKTEPLYSLLHAQPNQSLDAEVVKEIIFNLSEYKDVLPDELKEQVFTQMSLITQMIAYPRSMQSEIDQLLGEYIDKGTFGEYESIIRPSIEGYKFAVYLHRNNYDTKTDKDKSLLKGHEKTYKKKHNVTTDAWRTIESDALRRLQTSDKLLPRTVHDEQVVHLLVQYADYLQSQVMLDEMRGGVYVGPELFTFFGRNKLVHPLTQEIMETIYDTHLLATISNVLQQSDTLIPECKIKDDLINYLTDPKDTPAQRQGKYEKAVAMFSADISLWHLFIRKIMPEIASQDHGDKTIEAFIQQKIEQGLENNLINPTAEMTPTSLISLLYTAQQLAAIQDMYRKYQETFDRLVTYISELKSNEATLRLKKNIAAILLGHPITDTDLSQQNSTLGSQEINTLKMRGLMGPITTSFPSTIDTYDEAEPVIDRLIQNRDVLDKLVSKKISQDDRMYPLVNYCLNELFDDTDRVVLAEKFFVLFPEFDTAGKEAEIAVLIFTVHGTTYIPTKLNLLRQGVKKGTIPEGMIKYRTRLGLCGEETKTVDNPEDGKLTALQTAIDGIQNNMDILTVLPLFKSYDEQLMDLGVDPKYAEDKEMLLNYEQWFTGLMNKGTPISEIKSHLQTLLSYLKTSMNKTDTTDTSDTQSDETEVFSLPDDVKKIMTEDLFGNYLGPIQGAFQVGKVMGETGKQIAAKIEKLKNDGKIDIMAYLDKKIADAPKDSKNKGKGYEIYQAEWKYFLEQNKDTLKGFQQAVERKIRDIIENRDNYNSTSIYGAFGSFEKKYRHASHRQRGDQEVRNIEKELTKDKNEKKREAIAYNMSDKLDPEARTDEALKLANRYVQKDNRKAFKNARNDIGKLVMEAHTAYNIQDTDTAGNLLWINPPTNTIPKRTTNSLAGKLKILKDGLAKLKDDTGKQLLTETEISNIAKVWMREGLCAQPPIQMLQPIVETYCTGVKEFIDLYNAAEDKGKFMQEGKEKGMYHQFCYDPDAIYEQVSTISGMEGKFKIASNTLLTDELLALYAQAYTILKPYFLESKKASFESTEGPKILEAYMQQHSSSEKTAIESPKSLFSSKILDGNYVFSSCPAEAKIIKYENNTLTYTLGGKEFTMTDESQLRKGILYKKDLVANLFANGVDARHRVQVEENLSVELLHMPSVDAFFLWLEDNIEGKNGYRLSRTQCKIIFDTLNTYEAEKKLFAYPEAEKTFQEVQDTKVKERFEKGITKQETRELLTAYPYLEMYVPYLGVDFELMGTGMYGFVVDCGNNRVAKILRKGTSHDIFKDEYEEHKSIYNRFRRCDNSTFRDVYVPEAEGKINFDGMSYIKYEKVDGNSVLMTYAKQHYKQSIQDKIISPGIYTQAQIDEMSDFKLRNMLSLYLGLDETQLVKAGDEAVSQLKNKYKPYDNHPRKAIALLEVTMGAETAQQVYNFLETLDKDMHKRHPDLHGDNIMIDKDGHIAIIDRGH